MDQAKQKNNFDCDFKFGERDVKQIKEDRR